MLRADPEAVKRSQRARGNDVAVVDQALAADAARRSALTEFERLRAEQNEFGKRVKVAAKEDKPALISEAQQLAAAVKTADARAKEAEAEFDRVAGSIQNLIIDGVPAGSEENFVTLREVGALPTFDFEPRDHLELGELLGAIDMERGAKVSPADAAGTNALMKAVSRGFADIAADLGAAAELAAKVSAADIASARSWATRFDRAGVLDPRIEELTP